MNDTTNTLPALPPELSHRLERYERAGVAMGWIGCEKLRAAIFAYGDQRAREAAEQMREQEPSAWLVTGSRIYQDTVLRSQKLALDYVAGRKDGSRVEALFRALPTTGDSNG